MTEKKIQPALTPEEWASKSYERIGHGIVLFDDSPDAVTIQLPDGRSLSVRREHLPALAALCLHGRISWEMVDALRAAARLIAPTPQEAEDQNADGVGVDDILSIYQAEGNQVRAVADLLESLLPPREP